jgi:hypothetical protein
MSREDHVQAVGFAGLKIQEAQQLLIAAREKLANEAVPLVIVAVGETPATDSGRNALEMTMSLSDRLDELVGIAENAIQEMNRYSGGF